MANYKLRNGFDLLIREPKIEDAESLVKLMKQVDTESLFLAREPGEFQMSIDREKEFIQNVISDTDRTWFIAEHNGNIIGQCSIGLVNRFVRYRHRAGIAFVIIKEYWNLGIGGKMMQECINWAKSHNIEKLELDVVSSNTNAISMYESFGFIKTGTIQKALKYSDGTYADEYIMELFL